MSGALYLGGVMTVNPRNEGSALVRDVKSEIPFNLINRNTYIGAEVAAGDIIPKVPCRR